MDGPSKRRQKPFGNTLKLVEDTLYLTQLVMDRAPDSIIWMDDQGAIVYVNDAACTSLGYTRDELLSMTLSDIDPDRERDTFENEMKNLRRLGSKTFDARRRTKDGRLFPVEITTNYFEYKGRFIGISFDRDIAARKRAESERESALEALRESEEKYRFLMEQMSDTVWTLDMNMRPTYVSQASTDTLGFTPEERLQQNLSEMVTPETYKRLMTVLAQELEKEQDPAVKPNRSIVIEMEYYHKKGHTRWLENRVRAIRDTNGTIAGLHGVSRDITDRKEAERDKYHREKLQGILEMAGTVCHEMNQPMQIILGLTELLLKKTAQDNPDYQKLCRVKKQIQRMNEITDKLMSIQHYKTEDYAGFTQIIDINDLHADADGGK